MNWIPQIPFVVFVHIDIFRIALHVVHLVSGDKRRSWIFIEKEMSITIQCIRFHIIFFASIIYKCINHADILQSLNKKVSNQIFILLFY